MALNSVRAAVGRLRALTQAPSVRRQATLRLMQFDLLRAMGYGDSDPATNGEARALAAVVDRDSTAVVVDVGANRGDFSARALALGASVLAFEPSPSAFAQLERRFADDPRIRAFPFGLSDRNEEGAFLRASEPGSTHGSLYPRARVNQGAVERVDLRRLDETLEGLGVEKVDFLKVDAEGHDVAVLAGAGAWLDGVRIRAVQFEHGGTAPDARVFLRDFFELLTPAYRIHRIVPDGFWPLDRYTEVEEVTLYANYLALPR